MWLDLKRLRSLGTIRTVPFTATVVCNVDGCRSSASRNKSQLEAHTQRRTTRRSDVCLDEVNVSAVTWRHGLCSPSLGTLLPMNAL
jgi:hypothetical protein